MLSFRSQSSISELSVLYIAAITYISATAIAATVPSNSTLEPITVDSTRSNENKPGTVYDQTQEKVYFDLACECVPYYQCDPQDVVVLSTSNHDHDQNQCQGEVQVCCAERNQTSSSSQSELPLEAFADPAVGTEKVDSYGTIEAAASAVDSQCECVKFFLCDQGRVIPSNQCGDSDHVCCKNATSSATPSIEMSLPNITEPKVVKYHEYVSTDRAGDEPVQVEMQCECTSFYKCHQDDVVQLPKSDSNEEQCPHKYVCCRHHTHVD